MKVVLLKNVPNLGQVGDIREISDGFARNYLIPHSLVEPVNKHDIEVLRAQANKRQRIKKEEEKNRIKLARRINGTTLRISAKADDRGTLYAKIDSNILADNLQAIGYQILSCDINLSTTIKKTGEYNVELKVGGEKIIINLEINSDK